VKLHTLPALFVENCSFINEKSNRKLVARIVNVSPAPFEILSNTNQQQENVLQHGRKYESAMLIPSGDCKLLMMEDHGIGNIPYHSKINDIESRFKNDISSRLEWRSVSGFFYNLLDAFCC